MEYCSIAQEKKHEKMAVFSTLHTSVNFPFKVGPKLKGVKCLSYIWELENHDGIAKY